MERERIALVNAPDSKVNLPNNYYDSADHEKMSLADQWFTFLADPFF